jgi:hypothetical protein
MPEIVPLATAIREHVQDGATLALEGFTHLIPFAAGHEHPHSNDAGPNLRSDDRRRLCSKARFLLGRQSGRRFFAPISRRG